MGDDKAEGWSAVRDGRQVTTSLNPDTDVTGSGSLLELDACLQLWKFTTWSFIFGDFFYLEGRGVMPVGEVGHICYIFLTSWWHRHGPFMPSACSRGCPLTTMLGSNPSLAVILQPPPPAPQLSSLRPWGGTCRLLFWMWASFLFPYNNRTVTYSKRSVLFLKTFHFCTVMKEEGGL